MPFYLYLFMPSYKDKVVCMKWSPDSQKNLGSAETYVSGYTLLHALDLQGWCPCVRQHLNQFSYESGIPGELKNIFEALHPD